MTAYSPELLHSLHPNAVANVGPLTLSPLAARAGPDPARVIRPASCACRGRLKPRGLAETVGFSDAAARPGASAARVQQLSWF